MNFFKKSKYFKCGLMIFIVFAICVFCFDAFYSFRLQTCIYLILDLLAPFILALFIAYLLNPIGVFFERKIFFPLCSALHFKAKEKWIRVAALICTFMLSFAFVVFLFYLLIPQILLSMTTLINKLSHYYVPFENKLTEIFNNNPALESTVTRLLQEMNNSMQQWMRSLSESIPKIWNMLSNGFVGMIGFITNLILGITISVYLLFSKEKFLAQTKKVLFAVLPKKIANHTLSLCGEMNSIFGNYITGTLIDSLIIGILCFIGVSVMKMPYSVLIAFIVGVLNVIPFLGPFLGAIPSAFIILVEDPQKTIWFIIFIFLLQQFDGNVLKPKILGQTIGLPTFWILFSILIGGGLFGFVGMVLGVPVFSVIYLLFSRLVHRRLRQKHLSVNTEDYMTHVNTDNYNLKKE